MTRSLAALTAVLLLAACRTADGWPEDPPLETARFEGHSVAAVAEAVSRQFKAHGFAVRPEAADADELVFDRPWSRGEMFRDGELTADDGAPGGPMWLRLRVRLRQAGPGVVEARSDCFYVADHGAVMRDEQPLAHHRAAVHAGLLSAARRALLSAPPEAQGGPARPMAAWRAPSLATAR